MMDKEKLPDEFKFYIRILKFLAKKDRAEIHQEGCYLVMTRGEKRIKLPQTHWQVLEGEGYVCVKSQKCFLTVLGKKFLKRYLCEGDAFQEQHQNLKPAHAVDLDKNILAKVNINESPLMRLKFHKTKSGQVFLSDGEFCAGERLRQDFERSQISPQITMNWSRLGDASSSSKSGAGGKVDLKDDALAAKQRMDEALAAVGPELNGVLLDICCFLKGIGVIERERSWPQRSAKFMVKIALGILARHYGFEGAYQAPKNEGKIRHWGSDDYRPIIS